MIQSRHISSVHVFNPAHWCLSRCHTCDTSLSCITPLSNMKFPTRFIF